MSNLIIPSHRQVPAILEDEFKKSLDSVAHASLLGLCVQPPTKEGFVLGQLLSRILLEYCAYLLAPVTETPNPFDDPFVGAALITDKGYLLGAHRKEKRNEPHAEPLVLLRALASLKLRHATELVERIARDYKRAVWLQSEDERLRFVDSFRSGGDIVREFVKAKSLGERLILISTLEPCRDFETQPGCAHLISAFRPDVVLYACDDTNAKGQGRRVLQDSKIPVIPNLFPELNIQLNRLFYASVDCLQRIHSTAVRAPNPFSTRYCVAQLDLLRPSIRFTGDRLTQVFEDHGRPAVYEAPIEPEQTTVESPNFLNSEIDLERAVFMNNLDVGFISYYFQAHESMLGKIPGILVLSRLEDGARRQSARAQKLLADLRTAGVRVFSDVLRKAEEQALAGQYVRRWAESEASFAHLYLIVKRTNGYRSLLGSPEKIVRALLALRKARKIIISFDPSSRTEVLKLIRRLKGQGAFGQNHLLANVSFELLIYARTQELARQEERYYRSELQKAFLLPRFSVSSICSPREDINLSDLRRDLMEERIDPIATITITDWKQILDAPDWQNRRTAGLFLASVARRDTRLYRRLLIDNVRATFDPESWRATCSSLNALSAFGRPQNFDDLSLLLELLADLGASLDSDLVGKVPPIYIDVVWRFLATVCSIVSEEKELRAIVAGPNLLRFIGNSEFLLKELILYSLKSQSAQKAILKLALDLLEQDAEGRSLDQLQNILLRATRVAVLAGCSLSIDIERRLAELQKLNSDVDDLCRRERKRCEVVRDYGLAGVLRAGSEGGRMLASYLFLRTAEQGRGSMTGLPMAVGQEVRRKAHSGVRDSVFTWRGDKTSLARLVLSEIPGPERFEFLRELATDEDATIQWAALILAMDIEYRRAEITKLATRRECWILRLRVAEVVETILKNKPFYWLQREFLAQFRTEHFSDISGLLPLDARLQIIDLPSGRSLLFEAAEESLHPEVVAERQILRQRTGRALLILPPLELQNDSPAPTTTTPPLGLGSLASFLLAHGNDVEVLDCHRFPEYIDKIYKRARDYDVIGFSIVTSTYRATKNIIAQLRHDLVSGDMPVVVLGGHAVTLHKRDFEEDVFFLWDYLVVGDGEKPLLQILNSAIVNRSKANLSGRSEVLTGRLESGEWDSLPWIERRLFVAPDGHFIEPSYTRNARLREAHVVMSRGCMWKCSFCTEAILRGKGGELRRAANDVIDEVRFLADEYRVDRIQFIDDNIFPQIAVPSVSRAASQEWAHVFLLGLASIRAAHPTFSWRGICRFEDFLSYEMLFGTTQWMELLKASGCSLLAFGVEHGLEAKRQSLKGGNVSNDQIKGVIHKLEESGIGTKGYFMIGGEGENSKSTKATIDFAIEAGFSLAYFALYKNFRGLVRASKLGTMHVQDRERKFMEFKCLTMDLYEIVDDGLSEQICMELLGNPYRQERIHEAEQVVKELHGFGFKFRDVFKYNDFHADLGDHNEYSRVWSEEVADSPDSLERAFLQAVRRAYFEFYTRRDFVATAKRLYEQGY